MPVSVRWGILRARVDEHWVFHRHEPSRDKITFHTVVGTRDQGVEALTENGMEVWKRVTGKLERGAGNIRSFYVKTSMGPSIKVEVVE